uniref:Uncharacterized protein n=1 Tax=Parascaris equorum TaxID=6256 RepID=A0A914S0M9_PAREQ
MTMPTECFFFEGQILPGHESTESFKGGPNWKLHQLYLEYNHLSDLPAALFSSNLDRLKMLSIDDCNISNLDDDLFDDLISLEELSVRNNPFTEVPKALSDIPSLISLDMSFTDVTELQNVVLSNATELYMIHAGAFGWNHSGMNVAKLTNFNVEFANLTALSPNLFDTSELETAKLGGNRWNCICDMMWILGSHADFDQGSKMPIRLILSLFVIVSASMIIILFYYVVTNYRIRNVFYRPDMPHIGYSNLNRAEEEERKKNAMATTQQSPEN